jgi:serine/threonine protein kinase, bacterial
MHNNTLNNNQYQIEKKLGEGGFGETFLAIDTHSPTQRKSVIKQLKPMTINPVIYEVIQDRFKREAVVLEKLGDGHNQIPRLYAYFEENHQFYLVQEYIEGECLSSLKAGSLSEDYIQDLLLNLLPVLVYIHQQGIVHRDIKPDNIIIRNKDNKPVLIDFGAVRETMSTTITSSGNTTSSIIIGTPGFMSSEQAIGRPVFNSDLYSLGLTAIYLLTGKHPQDLATDTTTGDIIWRNFAPYISHGFAQVLDTAIKSHPRDRFPSAQAMLQSLQSLQYPTIPPTIPVINPINPTPIPTPINDNQSKLNFSVIIASLIISCSIIIGLIVTQRPQEKIADSPQQTTEKPTNNNSPQVTETPSNPPKTSQNTPANPQQTPTINNGAKSDNNYSWLANQYVTDQDLQGKSAWELDVMRNSIYAKHGRMFKSQELQDFFNRQNWYKPRYSPEEFDSYNFLSAIEKNNAAYILNYQNQHNLRYIF